jgi:hypothetical protein
MSILYKLWFDSAYATAESHPDGLCFAGVDYRFEGARIRYGKNPTFSIDAIGDDGEVLPIGDCLYVGASTVAVSLAAVDKFRQIFGPDGLYWDTYDEHGANYALWMPTILTDSSMEIAPMNLSHHGESVTLERGAKLRGKSLAGVQAFSVVSGYTYRTFISANAVADFAGSGLTGLSFLPVGRLE